MKRTVFIALMVIGIAALASAKGRDGWGRDFPGMQQPPASEAVTGLSGSLTIVQGSLAIKSGDTSYLLPGLRRYVGFIDSLKDGAQIKVDGSAFTSPQDAKIKVLRITKLTAGGKDYDLSHPQPQAAPAFPQRPSMPMMPHMPRGRW